MIRRSTARLAGLALTIYTAAGMAATLRVPQQFATIQSAVEAAAAGDTVLVGPGRYVENVNIPKSLTLRSTRGASRTTIDGGGIGSPVAASGTEIERITISGFTLQGGTELREPVLDTANSRGAGVFIEYVAMATISENIIINNSGCIGSGIVAIVASVSIHDNVVRANHPVEACAAIGEALHLGGGGAHRPASILRNQIADNRSTGLWIIEFGDVSIRDNTITGNGMGLENMSDWAGMFAGSIRGVIANNVFARNFAYSSPAIVISEHGSLPIGLTISENLIVDNDSVGGYIGAVSLSSTPPSFIHFRGNVVIGDSAGTLVFCSASDRIGPNLLLNLNAAGGGSNCVH